MSWELLLPSGQIEVLSEADIIYRIATGRIPANAPCRPVGQEGWRDPRRHMPFGAAAVESPHAWTDPSIWYDTAPSGGFFSWQRITAWFAACDRSEIASRLVIAMCSVLFVVIGWGTIRACNKSVNDTAYANDWQQRREVERWSANARAASEARQAERLSAERFTQELKATEDAQSPAWKAALSEHDLDQVDDSRAAFCRAQRRLESISASDRKAPEVAKAFRRLRARELQELSIARKEAEKARSIVCADGSISDCSCHGAHSGCCSHHGGIAGCEPIEKIDSVACGG